MFQDYENIPEAFISESWLSEKFFDLRDAIEELSETQQEAFFVWCDHHNSDISEEDADDLCPETKGDDRKPNKHLVTYTIRLPRAGGHSECSTL